MFVIHTEDGYSCPVEGIEMKPMAYGEKTHLVRFKLSKGAILPDHAHPHEQTGYLVSGRMILKIDGKDHEANPGDSWTIPGDVIHGAQILEDSVAIEVFSPVREDYLKA